MSGGSSAALLHCLDRNYSLVEEPEKKIRLNLRDYNPPEPLDLTVLNATAVKKYELLGVPTCESVDRARYELMSLDTKLDVVRRLVADASRSALVLGEVEKVNKMSLRQVAAITMRSS